VKTISSKSDVAVTMIAAPIVSIVEVRSGVRIIGGSMTSIIVEPENANKIKIVKFTSLLAKPTKSCTCLGSLASQQQRMVYIKRHGAQAATASRCVIQMTLRQFKRGLSKICLNDHANT
jgi:hypothetical protein